MEKKNFITQLHICCDQTNRLRPEMTAIHFKDGFAYATNAHVAIKQSLKYCGIPGKELLEGKKIHWKVYRDVMKYKEAEVKENGIEVKDNTFGYKILFPFYEVEDGLPGKIEIVMKQFKLGNVEEIGINPDLLAKVKSAFFRENVSALKVEFMTKDNQMMVTIPQYPDQQAIVMPAIIYSEDYNH